MFTESQCAAQSTPLQRAPTSPPIALLVAARLLFFAGQRHLQQNKLQAAPIVLVIELVARDIVPRVAQVQADSSEC